MLDVPDSALDARDGVVVLVQSGRGGAIVGAAEHRLRDVQTHH
jgi:hypothetical protein